MSSWHTRLKLRWPIVQAPMAGVQDTRLALAACHAGALGSIPAAMLSPSTLQQSLEAMRAARVPSYNVNFFCHRAVEADAARDAAWRDRLAPFARSLAIEVASAPPVVVRRPFGAEAFEVISAFKPPVVSFHFGLPSPEWLESIKAWATVIASATTVDEARWLESHGADVIIAQGWEAGGHRGMFMTDDVDSQRGTLALVPAIVDAVSVPVIAAGGIADARAVTACLALGASGVQVGTAFLLCPEATTSEVHRDALRRDGGRHTVVTNVFTGRPARGIVNRLIESVGPMSIDAPAFPHAASALAPLRAAAEAQGSGNFSPLWSGQGGCTLGERPAADVITHLAQGFIDHTRLGQ